MKKETNSYYTEVTEQIKSYIKENLKQPDKLTIDSIGSSIGQRSAKHLTRIFKSRGEMPLGKYIHIMRMAMAMEMLMSGMKPADVQTELNYNELSAFSSEFKKVYGVSPSAYKDAAAIKYKPTKNNEIMEMKVKIIELKPTPVLYVQTVGSYNSKAPEKAWNKLWDFVDKKGVNVEKANFYGIVHDDTEVSKASQCRYDACITSDIEMTEKEGVQKKVLNGGKYAVFTHKGPYKTLDAVYDWIYGEWLERGEKKLDDRPILEKYLNDPEDIKSEDLITEIFVPIL